MGILKDRFGGQHRVTPHRDLEPRYTGKTIFTNREPVPLIHRVAGVLFSLGFIGVFYAFLDTEYRHPESLADEGVRILLLLMIACCAVAGLLALFGLPPFRSKRRR